MVEGSMTMDVGSMDGRGEKREMEREKGQGRFVGEREKEDEEVKREEEVEKSCQLLGPSGGC
jgi:hypothetical protein